MDIPCFSSQRRVSRSFAISLLDDAAADAGLAGGAEQSGPAEYVASRSCRALQFRGKPAKILLAFVLLFAASRPVIAQDGAAKKEETTSQERGGQRQQTRPGRGVLPGLLDRVLKEKAQVANGAVKAPAGDSGLCVLDPGMTQGLMTFFRRKSLAQTFVPTASGSLTKITHGLQKPPGSVVNYTLLITTTTGGGLPTWTGGSVAVSSTVLYSATGLTSFATSNLINGVVPVSPALPLTAGTKYALVLIPGAPATGTMHWRGTSNGGAYTSGEAYELNGGVWSFPPAPPRDHGFKLEGICPPPPSKWCCPGTNLVQNGDFEAGNVGINSAPGYTFNPALTPGATLPGNYNEVTGAQALGISPTWVAADHATCTANTGKFLVVNGRTTQTTGFKTIWKQTVAVVRGKEYRFCANVKNLPRDSSGRSHGSRRLGKPDAFYHYPRTSNAH